MGSTIVGIECLLGIIKFSTSFLFMYLFTYLFFVYPFPILENDVPHLLSDYLLRLQGGHEGKVIKYDFYKQKILRRERSKNNLALNTWC